MENNVVKRCKLRDVLYVPGLAYNLLSVSKVAESGIQTTFCAEGCRLVDANQNVVATARKSGKLYRLCVRRPVSESASTARVAGGRTELWHKRYGHLGVQDLEALSRGGMVDGLDLDQSKTIFFCEPCVMAKSQRTSFPKTSGTRATKPLALIHTDVCGKISTKSLSGAEYFVTFIDDYSRRVWVYFIRNKSEVFGRFVEWKAMVEKSTGAHVKTLRSDNGGEYLSSEFIDFLKKEGVRHELTIPYTPEQNGVAERMNRTLVESSRAMLRDAKLPKKFWAETVSTAVYIRNRCPTKAVRGQTPMELYTGEKPNVQHLRTFGCTSYAHVPKEQRKKLDGKATKCVFLGYGESTKGYRLYDMQRNRVIHSRDVVFNEHSRAYSDPDSVTVTKPTEDKPKPTSSVTTEPTEEDVVVSDGEEDKVVREVEILNEEEPDEGGVHHVPEVAQEPPRRYPQRDRNPPAHFEDFEVQFCGVSDADVPKLYEDAMKSPKVEKWREAMDEDIRSLSEHNTYELTKPPDDHNVIGGRWVYALKEGADGSRQYKARYVAKGFSQIPDIDYQETFSPTARISSIRMLCSLDAQNGLYTN